MIRNTSAYDQADDGDGRDPDRPRDGYTALEVEQRGREQIAEWRHIHLFDQADASVEQLAERRERYTRRLATLNRLGARVEYHRARLEREYADVIA